MRAGCNACRSGWKFAAHVAFGRFCDWQIRSRVPVGTAVVIRYLRHSDVLIRAGSGACTTTDTNGFMNLDKSSFVSSDGSRGAPYHANRVTTLHASFHNLQAVMG